MSRTTVIEVASVYHAQPYTTIPANDLCRPINRGGVHDENFGRSWILIEYNAEQPPDFRLRI